MTRCLLLLVGVLCCLSSQVLAQAPLANSTGFTNSLEVPYKVKDPIVDANTTVSFDIFGALLEVANLTDTVDKLATSASGVTLLAPTDDVFSALSLDLIECLLAPSSEAVLAQILSYHVVPQRLTAPQFSSLNSTLQTLAGPISVHNDSSNFTVLNDQAGLVYPNLYLSRGGSLQGLNGILAPPALAAGTLEQICSNLLSLAPAGAPSSGQGGAAFVNELLSGSSYNLSLPFGGTTTVSFSMLASLLEAAGLMTVVEELAASPSGVTILGPTNNVFVSLDPALVSCLFAPRNKLVLAQVLSYHIVSQRLTADQISAIASADSPYLQSLVGLITVSIVSRGATSFNSQGGLLFRDVILNRAGSLQGINTLLLPPALQGGGLTSICSAGPAPAPAVVLL